MGVAFPSSSDRHAAYVVHHFIILENRDLGLEFKIIVNNTN